jgi:monovalent cation:H+ antiporter-2, CPA2 family
MSASQGPIWRFSPDGLEAAATLIAEHSLTGIRRLSNSSQVERCRRIHATRSRTNRDDRDRFRTGICVRLPSTSLGLPPLVGYLIAGVCIGPSTPGFVADREIAGQLAEIGVILLMFGVGLHFSAADLMAVRRIAVPGAIGQIIIATAIGVSMTTLWGWSFGAGLVLGLSLSVASTVVMLRALEERNAIETPNGRVAIGWLIVEDLAMVVALVLLPAFAEAFGGRAADAAHAAPKHGLAAILGITFAKVAAFLAVLLLIGPRVLPWMLTQVARTGSRELFTLCVLAVALGVAFGAADLFGVSFALGAFLRAWSCTSRI